MKCSKCKNVIKEGSKFCGKCGKVNKINFLEWLKNIVILNKKIILIIISILIIVFIASWLTKLYKLNQIKIIEKEQKIEEVQKQKNTEIDKLILEVEELKNKKPEIVKQTIIKEVPVQKSSTKATLQTVIKQWEPYIAYVECQFRYANGKIYQKQSGSGILYFNPEPNPDFSILTNKHVLLDDEGYGTYGCSTTFPNYDNNVFTTIDDQTVSTFSLPRNDADAAFIGINNPDDYIRSLKDPFSNYCQNSPSLGDQVVILGFPAIGSPTGVTVTQGIISGFDGDYFITDAKIDHGNSGGVAINIENNCYLGLPTWAATGEIESLARILKWQGIHN